MKTRVLVVVLVLLTVINVSGLGVLLIHRFRQPPPPCAQRPLRERMMRELDLSPRQRKALQSFRRQFREGCADRRKSLYRTHRALVEQLRQPEPDLARIDSLVDHISELQAAIQRVAVRTMLEEKAKLAPEQQQRWFELYEQFLERRRPMLHGGMSPRKRHPRMNDRPPGSGMHPGCGIEE